MKFKIKFLILFIIFSMNISCSKDEDSTPVTPTTETSFKWLSTQGNVIVDEDGNAVILRGVNRSGLEYDPSGNRMSEEEFNYIIQDWQAKIIRLPFNPEWIMIDEEYNQRLDNVINWIKENGAYVILDLQWQNTVVKIPRIPDSTAIEMWKKLAERYKNDPAILYDIHNEAHDVSFEEWRARAIEIIEAIQSVHPRALILVSGLNWAKDIGAWADNPLPHPNIVYSIHLYPWFSGSGDFDGLIGDYAEKIPIFVGEFGGYEENIPWGKKLISYLDKKKLGWTAWSWVDDPHLTEADNITPTVFGELVRNVLLRYANPELYANKIYDVKVEFVTFSRATVNWKSSNQSDSKVRYGLTSTYTDSVYAPITLTTHTIKLKNLQSNTKYYFKVISEDEFLSVAESADSTFTTLPE